MFPYTNAIVPLMEITTNPSGVTIKCANSSAIHSLNIVGEIVIVRYNSNPNTTYVYDMGDKASQLLPTLIEMDSAGKFVASFVKPMSRFVTKHTSTEVGVC